MPSSLPIELLRLILDNFTCPPISNDGTLENPHRHELLSLCLTSKIFRQIAQPLLFEVISLKVEEGKLDDKVDEVLLVQTEHEHLSVTRIVSLEGDDIAKPARLSGNLLTRFLQACPNLDQLSSVSFTLDLDALSGFNLRKLCLSNVSLLDCNISAFCLPELQILSLLNMNLPPDELGSSNFPSLRHLAYDDCNATLARGTAASIASLAPQLDSLLLVFDIALDFLQHRPSFPLKSTLIDYLDGLLYRFPIQDRPIEYVRFYGHNLVGTDQEVTSALEGLSVIAGVIEDSTQCRQLRTVYLPPLVTLDAPDMSIPVRQAVDRLLLACQNRKVETVHEEQPTGIRAETQMSEEFMRRMAKERIEREASNGM